MKTIQVSIILILFCILSAQDSIYVNFKLPYLLLQPTLFGGDLNGDGFDDMVFVGMRMIDQSHLGVLETMIYFGETYIDSFPDIAYVNTPDIPSYKICYNGDLNGDGINDMVLSDPGYPEWYNYGMLWIILGKSDFQMEPDYIMYGIDYFHGDYPYDSFFGIDIDCSGDFNGDGYDDLYVYAPGISSDDYGYFWIFNGGSEIDITDDYFHKGEYNSFTGESYSIGDINGDGFDDLIISRFDYDISEYVFDVYAGSENGLSENPVRTFIKEDNLYDEYDISGDFDGDGKNDLMKQDGHSCFISYGNENYEFERDINFLYNSNQYDSVPRIVDLNNDSISDIITDYLFEETQTSRINLYLGSPEGINSQQIFQNIYDNAVCSYDEIGRVTGSKKTSTLGGFRQDSNVFFCFLSLDNLENININEFQIPRTNSLYQNYPNPFNPTTSICFALPNPDKVTLSVYNLKGELVSTLVDKQSFDSGRFQIEFDGSNLSSGIYFYKIQTSKYTDIKRMIMVK